MPHPADHRVLDPLHAVLRLRADLQIECREFGGQLCYVIEDRLRGKFYRVGAAEHAFLRLLDGTRSVQTAIVEAAAHLREHAFNDNEALAICRWLLETQLVESDRAVEHARLLSKARPKSWFWTSLANPLCVRLPLFNPAGVIARVEPWLGGTLSRPFFVVWCVACSYGLFLAAANWHELASHALVLLDRSHWWLLAIAWVALKVLHETYHALVCRKYGGSVTEAGLFLLVFAPVPYVEVSSSWRFASKWQRIATAAAGMYIELLLAALALIVWAHSGNSTTKYVAISIATMASVGTIVVNANPLMRFDGYFILSDLVGIPNLSIHARRWLASLVERLIGWSTAPCGLSRNDLRIVAIYAIAALLWRTFVYITLVLAILVLLGRVHWLLAAVAGSAMAAGAGSRFYAAIQRRIAKQPQIAFSHVAAIGSIALAAVGLVGYWLASPATIRAPGIVEFEPLVIVRSSSAGFVRELHVEDGQVVQAGDVLAVLENKELAVQLRMAELDIEKSMAECRILRQAGETAKEQAALAAQSALRKLAADLARQIDSLTLRAPAAGKVLDRNLDAWLGRYVEPGTELFLIGDESSKHVVVALQQDDIDLFLQHKSEPIEVRFSAIHEPAIEATIESVEPRASVIPPHPALSSQVGGPLAVQLVEDAENTENAGAHGAYELLDPYFKASVRLSGPKSRQLRAGQLATVCLTTGEQSTFHRFQLFLRRYAGQLVRSE